MREPMETKTATFYTYRRKLYFTYWQQYRKYFNEHFQNNWHCHEEKAVFIGFIGKDEKWFEKENWYYDGHTFDSISFFGIVIGRMYTYDAREQDDDCSSWEM